MGEVIRFPRYSVKTDPVLVAARQADELARGLYSVKADLHPAETERDVNGTTQPLPASPEALPQGALSSRSVSAETWPSRALANFVHAHATLVLAERAYQEARAALYAETFPEGEPDAS